MYRIGKSNDYFNYEKENYEKENLSIFLSFLKDPFHHINGKPILHNICEINPNKEDIIYVLNNLSKDIISKKDGGLSVLHYLILNKKIYQKDLNYLKSLIMILLNHKSDFDLINEDDYNGDTVLHYICENKLNLNIKIQNEMILFLLENGACINKYNNYGNTPLLKICNNPNADFSTFKCLLDNDKHLINRWNHKDQSIIHLLCSQINNKIKEIKYIIKKYDYGNINMLLTDVDNRGWTCLHYICNNNNINQELFDLLLEHGANINARAYFGKSCVDILFNNDPTKEDIIYLLENGAEIKKDKINRLKQFNFDEIEIKFKKNINNNLQLIDDLCELVINYWSLFT